LLAEADEFVAEALDDITAFTSLAIHLHGQDVYVALTVASALSEDAIRTFMKLMCSDANRKGMRDLHYWPRVVKTDGFVQINTKGFENVFVGWYKDHSTGEEQARDARARIEASIDIPLTQTRAIVPADAKPVEVACAQSSGAHPHLPSS
jgi:hypothetical protein